jgi:hypothetical protein
MLLILACLVNKINLFQNCIISEGAMEESSEYHLNAYFMSADANNNQARPCPRAKHPRGRNMPCPGKVLPTYNTSIWKCDICKEYFALSILT